MKVKRQYKTKSTFSTFLSQQQKQASFFHNNLQQKQEKPFYMNQNIIRQDKKQEDFQSPQKKDQRSASLGLFKSKFESKERKKWRNILTLNYDESMHQENKNIGNERSSSGFAQKLKQNLRKTVFNETKMMLKEKKKKKGVSGGSIQLPDSHRDRSHNMIPFHKKNSLFMRNQQKIKEKKDTLYKTIVPIQAKTQLIKKIKNKELQISKFPLIARRQKLAEIKDLKAMFEKLQQNFPYNKSKFQIKFNQSPSQLSLQPWKTIVDQYD